MFSGDGGKRVSEVGGKVKEGSLPTVETLVYNEEEVYKAKSKRYSEDEYFDKMERIREGW